MELALLVYCISVLSSTKAVLSLIILMLAVFISIRSIHTSIEHDHSKFDSLPERETKTSARKAAVGNIKLGAWAIIGIAILMSLIPSEKTAYVMVAAYATQKVAQDPRTEVISGKVLKVIEQKLDSYIEDNGSKSK